MIIRTLARLTNLNLKTMKTTKKHLGNKTITINGVKYVKHDGYITLARIVRPFDSFHTYSGKQLTNSR
jgi:hypothetical protein